VMVMAMVMAMMMVTAAALMRSSPRRADAERRMWRRL
jgi:hypothetical protein